MAARAGHPGQPHPAADVHPSRRRRHDGPGRAPRAGGQRADHRRHLSRDRAPDHPRARRVVLAATRVHRDRPGRRDRPAGRPAGRSRSGGHAAPRPARGGLRRYLHPVRQHPAAGRRRHPPRLPLVQRVHQPARRPVPRVCRAQAQPRPGRFRRPAAAVAGRAGRPGGRAGAARHVRRGAGRRVPGRQRGAGRHRAVLAPRRRWPDLRRRRRSGHLWLPGRRPGTPAAADRRISRSHRRPAGQELPVEAGSAAAGQRCPPAVGRAGARADRRPRAGDLPAAGELPRRGDAGPRDLRAGPGGA